MKNFPLLFCFVLFLAFGVSAQTNQDATCPKINVSGGGVTLPGEPLTFTANVEGYDLSKLSFKWTISAGEILEGQDTPSLTVIPGNDGQNVTVTVEITGLPEGCPMTASETGSICSCVRPRLFDEYSIPASRIEKGIIDSSVIELTENPQLQLFIIEYFKSNTPKRIIERKIQKITNYLVNVRKLPKDRFTILVESNYEQNLTKIWLVPPGAENPAP